MTRKAIGFRAPLLAQRIMANVLQDELWLPHVDQLRAVYDSRRLAMLNYLTNSLEMYLDAIGMKPAEVSVYGSRFPSLSTRACRAKY